MNDKGKVEVCFKCSYALTTAAAAVVAGAGTTTTYTHTSDEVISSCEL